MKKPTNIIDYANSLEYGDFGGYAEFKPRLAECVENWIIKTGCLKRVQNWLFEATGEEFDTLNKVVNNFSEEVDWATPFYEQSFSEDSFDHGFGHEVFYEEKTMFDEKAAFIEFAEMIGLAQKIKQPLREVE